MKLKARVVKLQLRAFRTKMFSSNNNPFQQNNYFNYPSSSSSPLINHGNPENLYLQHYHHHLLTPPQFLLAYAHPETGAGAPPNPMAAMAAAASNSDSTNLFPEKPVKKDRHSKIYTSHGLRDRRVRLSIGIARQFFDLQDLLGFDKASNTIEWLLTKSKKAIKKLQDSKGKRFSSSSESEEVSETEEEDDDEDEELELTGSKEEETNNLQQASTVELLARSSRAKARERAKKRTREKIHTQKLTEMGRNTEKGFDLGGKADQFGDPCSDSVDKSVVITKKNTKQASNLNYQQSFRPFRDRSSPSYLSCLPENWDISGLRMDLSTGTYIQKRKEKKLATFFFSITIGRFYCFFL